jgi:hypothetical protein
MMAKTHPSQDNVRRKGWAHASSPPQMFAEFGKPGAAFSMKQQAVEGDYAYILWTAETADNLYEVGTDTFVVRDGKIVAQSFAGKITPKG